MPLTLRFRDINDLFHKCALFLVLFCRVNGVLAENDFVFMMVIGISCAGIALRFQSIMKMPRFYLLWVTGFLGLFAISTLWAMNSATTITYFIATVGRMIMVLYLYSHMNTMEGICYIIKTFLLAVVINNLFILAFFGTDILLNARVSGEAGSVGNTAAGNINSIGMASANAIILMHFIGAKTKKVKLPMLCIYAFLFGVIVLTGSKKALLILVMAVAIMYFLKSKHKVIVMAVIFAAVLVVYLLLLNIPILYNVIGNRIESLVNGIFALFKMGDFSVNSIAQVGLDISDRTRMRMILWGMEWFSQRPVLGYGMANYIDLYGTMAPDPMYSHNNYIEILVGLGLVGLCWYYSLYLHIIRSSLKRIKSSYYANVALMFIIMQLVLEIGLVSYLEINSQITIIIAYALASKIDVDNFEEGVICDERDKKSFG